MSKARSCRRLVLFLRRRQLNTTSFERGAKFRGTERGSEVEFTQHTTTMALHFHLRVSVASQVRWVVRYPRSRVVVVTPVRGASGPVVRTDNVTSSQSLRRGGNSTKESGTPVTESQRQDLRKSSRPGLSSVAGQVKASGSPVELACVAQRYRTSGGPAAQEAVFQPTGLRDFEGSPSLTEAHRPVRNWKHEW